VAPVSVEVDVVPAVMCCMGSYAFAAVGSSCLNVLILSLYYPELSILLIF